MARAADLGRENLRQPHLFQRGRQRGTLRSLGATRAFCCRGPCGVSTTTVTIASNPDSTILILTLVRLEGGPYENDWSIFGSDGADRWKWFPDTTGGRATAG